MPEPELTVTSTEQINQTATSVEPTPEQIQNQIGMAMAFDDVSLMPKREEPIIPAGTPESNTEPAVIIPTTTQTDYASFLKENFGVESIEDAKTQWHELQALRANPPKPAEITFADEQSKKIHELLREGKVKEVAAFLSAQEMLGSVDAMNDEQKLKLYIKMQNPKFDKELIDDEYNSLYSINEEELSEDPLKLRKERVRLEQRLENDVVKAQEYFSAYKQKIQLPDTQPQAAVTVDKDYEAYQASNAKADEDFNNITMPGINALKETDVALNVKVDDANNQMQFAISIVPTKEDFEKAKQDSLSLNQFLAKTCYDKDGKFIPQNLQRLVLLNNNFDNYAQSIARQAVNEERKRVIAKEAPNGNGSRDYNVNVDKTELQKQMDFALS